MYSAYSSREVLREYFVRSCCSHVVEASKLEASRIDSCDRKKAVGLMSTTACPGSKVQGGVVKCYITQGFPFGSRNKISQTTQKQTYRAEC